MILITKEQAIFIKKKYPDIPITLTCRQASKGNRKKRYIQDDYKVIKALEDYKNQFERVVFEYPNKESK